MGSEAAPAPTTAVGDPITPLLMAVPAATGDAMTNACGCTDPHGGEGKDTGCGATPGLKTIGWPTGAVYEVVGGIVAAAGEPVAVVYTTGRQQYIP
mmetsp:Transcript_80145/g.201646  ORF Transcript_80145/g.201646 Transcript_80145/m.201646 type:complete len:96 (-) Transcript_80145:79-366(-)